MTDDAPAALTYPTDAEIDEVLAEFGGDPLAAIAALLHDLSMLAGDYEGAVSKGYVWGETPDGSYGAALGKKITARNR